MKKQLEGAPPCAPRTVMRPDARTARTEARLPRLNTDSVTCPPGFADRLDRALAQLVPELSRGAARRLIDAGSVFVDGCRCRVASRMVRAGARLRVAAHETNTPGAPSVVLRVLYEDADCIAIDKPAGMPAAPTRSAASGTALDLLAEQLRERDGGGARLWLVHRLDAPTSGVLLFAKSRAAAAALGKSFASRDVEKTYIARVGMTAASALRESDRGTVDLALRNIGGRAKVVRDGQPAHTDWRVSSRAPDGALLELHPTTGRFHQLRAHLAAIGHPIAGDRLYGGPAAPRLMLHAAALTFPHPRTGARTTVCAPLPAELGAL